MRILGISGSLRADSHNSELLAHAAARLPGHAEFERFDGLREIPAFDEDLESLPPPDAVRELKQSIDAADGVLIATPEYNGSIPGALKNALDWASRPYDENPLRNKVVAVIGASAGRFGAVGAQADLRRVLARIGARVVPLDLPVGKAGEVFAGTDSALPEALHAQLGELIAEFVSEVEQTVASARLTLRLAAA